LPIPQPLPNPQPEPLPQPAPDDGEKPDGEITPRPEPNIEPDEPEVEPEPSVIGHWEYRTGYRAAGLFGRRRIKYTYRVWVEDEHNNFNDVPDAPTARASNT